MSDEETTIRYEYPYRGKRNEDKAEIARLTADLTEAERLIAAAVELMSPDQVGQWEGVRAWQERDT